MHESVSVCGSIAVVPVHHCNSANQARDDDDEAVRRHSIANNDTFHESPGHRSVLTGNRANKSDLPDRETDEH